MHADSRRRSDGASEWSFAYFQAQSPTMFTGIVEEIGEIHSLVKIGQNQLELTVSCHRIQEDMSIGDSIAVNGVCLTVVRFDSGKVTFELSSETMRNSTFSEQSAGEKLNLERALKLNDRLGGHIVQGHVDCVASVKNIKKAGGFYEIDFTLPAEIRKYVVKKGSITIDGISLTIADLFEDRFRVAIIPHTYEQTALNGRQPGDKVHLESDVLARYIERLLLFEESSEKKQPITEELLKKYGF